MSWTLLSTYLVLYILPLYTLQHFVKLAMFTRIYKFYSLFEEFTEHCSFSLPRAQLLHSPAACQVSSNLTENTYLKNAWRAEEFYSQWSKQVVYSSNLIQIYTGILFYS